MDAVTIYKVKNGYIVSPPFDPAPSFVRFADMHVFETIDGLFTWLREEFDGEQGLTPAAPDSPDGETLT